ncbi:MAG: DUF433 domain-containing protein [Deltaproteobacteria bacterium]|jgi:uncharacterized protein (DUF433 family)|nr:DUF433 domain-containing protein [Deltaproteobacteria bacterium]
MAVALQAKTYPHIGSDPKIADGKPMIFGTRITVRCIAGYYQMGLSADEILTTLPHLTPSQVHSALAYYFEHQEEVDTDLAESSETSMQKANKNTGESLAYCQRNNEEPFGVFVDSLGHSTYLRNKPKKQTVESIQPGSK